MAVPIVIFHALPATIEEGELSTLIWSTYLSTSVTVGGVVKPTIGSWKRYPTATISVELVATGPGGITTKTVTITVIKPSQVCTPGEKKCFDNDLYKCNAEGTNWELFETNAAVCRTSGPCPNWYDNLPGFVVCTILNAFESLLGLISGGFATLILNVQNFMDNFSTDIANFLKDPIGAISDAIGGVIATLGDIAEGATKAIGSWWDDQIVILQRGWDNTIGGLSDWFSDQIDNISDTISNFHKDVTDWQIYVSDKYFGWMDDFTEDMNEFWEDGIADFWTWVEGGVKDLENWIDQTVDNIGEWWDDRLVEVWVFVEDQAEILQRGWDNVVSDTMDWWDEQIIILQRGWDNTVSDIHDFINDTVPGIVEDMFDWAKPIVKPIEDAVGFLGSIAAAFTRTYPEDPRIKENTRTVQEMKDELRRKLEEL